AGRLGSVLLLFAFELPTLLFALSALFRWTRKRGHSWLLFVVLGILLAAAIGSLWGFLFFHLSELFPELGLRTFSTRPMSESRVMMYGLTQAQSQFGLWTLAFVLPELLDDARVRSLQAEKLQAESEQLRTAAELARLRSHLEPHFLLNTLNAIAGLVTQEPREARRLLSALGDLLRDALKNEGELQPLCHQVDWLRRYAQILETRHRGDLSFSWEVSEASKSEVLPRLLLQPLVENAVKHGALHASGPGHVCIRTQLTEDGSRLLCQVEDNGPGMNGDPVRAGAFGLESVKRRVALRYGDAGSVTWAAKAQGTIVTVDVPAGVSVP
ncbi:MAG TPA: histidine kinase, partial [Polyangiales bacterium]|nr:histidine kinase [Polyangiales bacterium]